MLLSRNAGRMRYSCQLTVFLIELYNVGQLASLLLYHLELLDT